MRIEPIAHARILRANGSQRGRIKLTDAVFPLRDCRVDRGYADTLRLLNQGRLPLRQVISQLSRASLDDAGRALLRELLAAPQSLFVTHTEGNEFFPGSSRVTRPSMRQHTYA